MSNGSTLLAGVDGRKAEARRFRDLCISLAAELGGLSVLTEPDAALVRHAAALTMQSEQMQRAAVRGQHLDAEDSVRVSNALIRTLGALRARAPRATMTPPAHSLESIIARHRAAEAAAKAATAVPATPPGDGGGGDGEVR